MDVGIGNAPCEDISEDFVCIINIDGTAWTLDGEFADTCLPSKSSSEAADCLVTILSYVVEMYLCTHNAAIATRTSDPVLYVRVPPATLVRSLRKGSEQHSSSCITRSLEVVILVAQHSLPIVT